MVRVDFMTAGMDAAPRYVANRTTKRIAVKGIDGRLKPFVLNRNF